MTRLGTYYCCPQAVGTGSQVCVDCQTTLNHYSDMSHYETLGVPKDASPEDMKPIFRGDVLFELKATHGFPLDFALDRIINDLGYAVDWIAFIEAARANKWWDFQTYECICHAMEDAQIDRGMQHAIKCRFQRYVVAHPHQLNKAVQGRDEGG